MGTTVQSGNFFSDFGPPDLNRFSLNLRRIKHMDRLPQLEQNVVRHIDQ